MIPKFRIWDKINKRFNVPKDKGAWFIRQDGLIEHQMAHGLCGLDDKGEAGYVSSNSPKNPDKYVIQFASYIRDKKGQIIYAGDIVRGESYESPVPVVFKHGAFGLQYANKILYFCESPMQEQVNLTIIGNIFENPELI
jgi:hypothetical protein